MSRPINRKEVAWLMAKIGNPEQRFAWSVEEVIPGSNEKRFIGEYSTRALARSFARMYQDEAGPAGRKGRKYIPRKVLVEVWEIR